MSYQHLFSFWDKVFLNWTGVGERTFTGSDHGKLKNKVSPWFSSPVPNPPVWRLTDLNVIRHIVVWCDVRIYKDNTDAVAPARRWKAQCLSHMYERWLRVYDRRARLPWTSPQAVLICLICSDFHSSGRVLHFFHLLVSDCSAGKRMASSTSTSPVHLRSPAVCIELSSALMKTDPPPPNLNLITNDCRTAY